jgi:hypothetical protein
LRECLKREMLRVVVFRLDERKITDLLLAHLGLDASSAFTESGVPNPGRLAAILKGMK